MFTVCFTLLQACLWSKKRIRYIRRQRPYRIVVVGYSRPRRVWSLAVIIVWWHTYYNALLQCSQQPTIPFCLISNKPIGRFKRFPRKCRIKMGGGDCRELPGGKVSTSSAQVRSTGAARWWRWRDRRTRPTSRKESNDWLYTRIGGCTKDKCSAIPWYETSVWVTGKRLMIYLSFYRMLSKAKSRCERGFYRSRSGCSICQGNEWIKQPFEVHRHVSTYRYKVYFKAAKACQN